MQAHLGGKKRHVPPDLGCTYSWAPSYPDLVGAPWEERGMTEAALYRLGSGLGSRSCRRELSSARRPLLTRPPLEMGGDGRS